MWISKNANMQNQRWIKNDNKNKSNTLHQAFCLLEIHLTRANRVKNEKKQN
jgi:hypothetical protein